MDRWEICWLGCTCRVRDGLECATRRLGSHRLASADRVTRYLARKRTPALCACAKGCDRDASSRCKEPSTSSTRIASRLRPPEPGSQGRRRGKTSHRHRHSLSLTADRITSILPRCISSAEAARCPPHCNLTPGASGVDESGGRAGVRLPSPARLLGPDDSCMPSAASVAWCRGE